ncbi:MULTISPECIES: YchJ family protein [unclassified Arthrobacter]|uniref:YchJ family protein n=1 Tax=unclassified Arthrobacter TaxID=235627 RepID=UPI001D14EBAB|nr:MULTISPECIES: YchJ family protein [unclassified Arthrobacter]MCC3291885.1 YchJ family protein [Arthrobacter sp. zg-Y1110]MCC9175354.1 YchJ family protein [Arthrobacter sp. zg-Y179]UWX85713.1 YchJ family protein [Arthrobacter sp. zg-Y1110]
MSTSTPVPSTAVTDESRCPCLSGETYGNCCGRFHSGAATAPTAEALMRSRYSAFATGNVPYLLATWHPDHRPANLELDAGIEWRRLDILSTSGGGPLDNTGTVEFRAHYREDGQRGTQQERSSFVRERGQWLYVEGR